MAYEHLVLPCTPDARLAPLIESLRNSPPGRAEDYLGTREAAELPHTGAAEALRAEGADVREVVAGGVPAMLVEPSGDASGTLIGLHGGSYVLCSATTHLRRFSAIGALAGLRTLVVDYRLAPEHPFPAGLHDSIAALRWAAANLDGPLALVGDSAGGGLALATLLRARDVSAPSFGAAVVISPWADLRCGAPSHQTRRARDPFAHLDDLPGYAALYAAGTDLDDPLASPVHGDYRGLPPLLVQIGSEETLYDDAIAVASAADAAGVDVRVEEWTGMFHTWHAYAGEVTGADEAIASAATFLRRVLG
ncbi:MAG: epsilon-lactone hydrolase [Streptosporangiaceae bacterium]|nr:epsilon-lactone hydrolase [Streptosporangiaceae bacterium]